jgi:hypothetical protein
MAKKRKKGKAKEEEYEFRPPDFDEKEFLEKELRDTKTVLITVGYAVVFGIGAGLLSTLGGAMVGLGFVLCLAGIVSLSYVYSIVKVDKSKFTKRNWAGNIAWFFFTFLAVWVLLFNYPFADHASPQVSNVTVWIHNEITDNITAIDYKKVAAQNDYAWVPRYGEDLATMIKANQSYTFNISAQVADNGRLRTAQIEVTGLDANFTWMEAEGQHRYGRTIRGESLIPLSMLRFTIRATDENNNVEEFTPNAALAITH